MAFKWYQIPITLFLFFHLSAVTFESWKVPKFLHNDVTNTLRQYLRLTNQQQNWKMFSGWSHWQTLEVEYLFEDHSGKREYSGGRLPNFTRDNLGIREQVFYDRLLLQNRTGKEKFLIRQCHLYEKIKDKQFAKVWVKIHGNQIKFDENSPKNSSYEPYQKTIGPVKC